MELKLVNEGGLKVVEGEPDQSYLSSVQDTDRVIEACMEGGTSLALLYADNLTAGFFDLSSGEAGSILQKLRNYRIRLAVVCPTGGEGFSTRFGEMVAEERRGRYFGLFATRHEARDWLGP